MIMNGSRTATAGTARVGESSKRISCSTLYQPSAVLFQLVLALSRNITRLIAHLLINRSRTCVNC